MIIRTRKTKSSRPRSARRKSNRNKKDGTRETRSQSERGPPSAKLEDCERTSLKKKLRLKTKYKDKVLESFSSWSDIQEKFLYDHSLIYREDRHLRRRFMKCISDTANAYMSIRRALGFREYCWTENPLLFLHMGLSKTLWRKAVKRLVDS
jgi:hypothetical protein